MLKCIILVIICFCLTGCGETPPPVENQIEVTSQPIQSPIGAAESVSASENFTSIILADDVTLQEYGRIKLPNGYKIKKVKKIDTLIELNALVCSISGSAEEKTVMLNCLAKELPASLNCTAMQLETPDGMKLTLETSNKTYDSFIWEKDSQKFYGEHVKQDSITLQKLTDNMGWYEDSYGYHVVITFDCGSLCFNAQDLKELREVIEIMIG